MATRTLVAIEARAEPIVWPSLNGFDFLEAQQPVCKESRTRLEFVTAEASGWPESTVPPRTTWILDGTLAEGDGGERNRKQESHERQQACGRGTIFDFSTKPANAPEDIPSP